MELQEKVKTQYEGLMPQHFRFLKQYGVAGAGEPRTRADVAAASSGMADTGTPKCLSDQMELANKACKQIDAETTDWEAYIYKTRVFKAESFAQKEDIKDERKRSNKRLIEELQNNLFPICEIKEGACAETWIQSSCTAIVAARAPSKDPKKIHYVNWFRGDVPGYTMSDHFPDIATNMANFIAAHPETACAICFVGNSGKFQDTWHEQAPRATKASTKRPHTAYYCH